MAYKVLLSVALAMTLMAVASAYPGMFNRGRYAAQFPRLMQAACLVNNVTTGEEIRSADCVCGDETAACDIGPVKFFDMELTFCNTLDDQTLDDLYVMQFACQSDSDDYCGTGTFCDLGPLEFDGEEYFLCRFAAAADTDDDDGMCKPDVSTVNYPMWGQGAGQQMGQGRGRWASAGGSAPTWGQNNPAGGMSQYTNYPGSANPPTMGQRYNGNRGSGFGRSSGRTGGQYGGRGGRSQRGGRGGRY